MFAASHAKQTWLIYSTKRDYRWAFQQGAPTKAELQNWDGGVIIPAPLSFIYSRIIHFDKQGVKNVLVQCEKKCLLEP